MKKLLLIISLTLATMLGFSQKQVDQQFNSWWTYSGNHKLTEKWGIHRLYSCRRNDFVKNWQQSLLRLGMNYQLDKNLTATLGYDWVETFPYGKQPIAKQTKEQRIFEQLMLKNKVGIFNLKHRYKLEQLFSNANLKHRFRYRFVISAPLGKKKIEDNTFFFTIFDEIFINLGGDTKGQVFNQNWIYTAVGYKLNKKTSFKIGYMNQFLMKSDNVHIESNNTLQIGFSHSFFPKE